MEDKGEVGREEMGAGSELELLVFNFHKHISQYAIKPCPLYAIYIYKTYSYIICINPHISKDILF